MNIGSD